MWVGNTFNQVLDLDCFRAFIGRNREVVVHLGHDGFSQQRILAGQKLGSYRIADFLSFAPYLQMVPYFQAFVGADIQHQSA